MSRDDRTLVQFWIVTEVFHAPLGFGVTAFDLEDAFAIILRSGYERYLPGERQAVDVTANVVFDDLPRHVREHCGPIVVRGLWYPWPTPGWFSRQQ